MTTFTRHDEGMPSWVDTSVATVEQHHDKRAFLTALFDWTWDVGPPETGSYAVAHTNGRPVFGLGIGSGGSGQLVTYFTTSSVEDAVRRATELGASVVMGPLDIGDPGTMALLADPTGATYGLWQPNNFHGFGVQYELNAPGWFDHVSSDPERAGAFYANVSGHELNRPGGDMRVLQKGEQWYASFSQAADGEEPHWRPIYVVDSLQRVHETVPRHGGAIVVEESPVPGSAICVFSEPVNGTLMTVMRAGEPPA